MGGTRTRTQRLLAVVGVGLVAVLLAACGARIDTQLSVDASGAGTRVMTLTLEDGLDSLLGGTAAADASIVRHKPAEVDYSGLSTGPAGELVATFTVTFADPEEYRQKMAALLAASDQQWTQENAFVVEQSRFLQGATIEETFDSQDLLQWLFNGLVADGVVADGDSGNMWELGATTVTYGGITYEVGSAVSFSEMVDRGFDSVAMETTVGDESFTRTLTYWVDDKAVYNSGKEQFDAFFAEVEAAGLTVAQDDSQVGVTWTASATTGSAEELVALTNAALLSAESVFEVTAAPGTDDPATSTITLLDHAECSAICSLDAQPVTEALTVPAGYTLISGGGIDESGAVTFPMSSTGVQVDLLAVHLFESVTTELTVGLTGGLTWTGDFAVAAADVEQVGDGFETLLAPSGDDATMTVAESTERTVYTVTLTGADEVELLTAYRAWSGAPESQLSLADLPGAGSLSARYQVVGNLGFSPVLVSHLPADGVTQSIVLPFGQSFDESVAVQPSTAAVDGDTFSVQGAGGLQFVAVAAGTTLTGYIVYGNLVLLVLVVGVVLVVFRGRIARAVARRREARAVAQAGVMGAPGAGAVVPGAGAVVPGQRTAPPSGVGELPTPSFVAAAPPTSPATPRQTGDEADLL